MFVDCFYFGLKYHFQDIDSYNSMMVVVTQKFINVLWWYVKVQTGSMAPIWLKHGPNSGLVHPWRCNKDFIIPLWSTYTSLLRCHGVYGVKCPTSYQDPQS